MYYSYVIQYVEKSNELILQLKNLSDQKIVEFHVITSITFINYKNKAKICSSSIIKMSLIANL